MSLTAEGSLDSYYESGSWWNNGCISTEVSQERRAQLAAEAEAAFRSRCSAFLLAAVEAVRRQCESCLAQAVDDALERYSALLHDALQLQSTSNDEESVDVSEGHVDKVDVKLEDDADVAEIALAEDVEDNKTALTEVFMEEQWATASEEPPMSDFRVEVEGDPSKVETTEDSNLEQQNDPPASYASGALSGESGLLHSLTSTNLGVSSGQMPSISGVMGTKLLLPGASAEEEKPPVSLTAPNSETTPIVTWTTNTLAPLPPPTNMCELCGRSFSRKSHLIRHRLVHTGERPFLCLYCHRRFSQKVHLKVHMCTHNALRAVSMATPTGASRVASQPTLVATSGAEGSAPMWSARFPPPTAPPPPQPPQPPGVSSSVLHTFRPGLPSHCPVHSQPPLHATLTPPGGPLPPAVSVAPQMGPQTATMSTLLLRRHRCTECGKAFTRASHLNRHRLVHTGERPHVCLVCSKAFSQKVHLQAHLRRQHAFVLENRPPDKSDDGTEMSTNDEPK